VARGGARPGAGRKKGSVNKLSTEATKLAASTGMLPHEILMRLGRGEVVSGFEAPAEGKKRKSRVMKSPLSLEQRLDCLKASAAFYAPKLMAAAIKQMPTDWNPYVELLESVRPSRGLPFRPKLVSAK
jgi:hypothetical protein